MYVAFLFTSKNRLKEETHLLTLFDGNMKPVLCKNYTASVKDALESSGFSMDSVKFPLGLIVVSVTQIKATQKGVMAKMTGEIGHVTK